MEYCCHVWASALGCYLELLDKLQKRLCRSVGLSRAAFLEPLGHRRNVASLSLFHRYYFGGCLSELARLVPLPYSRGRSTRYSGRFMIFVSPLLDVTRMSMSTVSFFTQLDSAILPTEYLPLTYDLNGFKSRINRHILTIDSFYGDFLYALIFLCFFFL